MTIVAAIAAALGLATTSGARSVVHDPGGPAAPVAICDLADGRSAIVTKTKGLFTYRFGRNAASELELMGDASTRTVFKRVASFPRAGWTQIRFVDGATSYILFHYYNLGNYVRNYDGATEQSGLIVIQGGRKLSMRLCKTAQGLENGADLETLPDDPEDHADDIIDDVERRR